MFSPNKKIQPQIPEFHIDHVMRYSQFAPRLYNLCLSLGFEPGKIMPSRAFCSDENQGFPIILISKHFGAFPFNHGVVGGMVATDRHGPHAHHGKDMVIIQASHVGYDPETKTFGTYCRLQTPGHDKSATCGKISGVLQWYLEEYRFAQSNILLGREGDIRTVTIDNQLMNEQRSEGLFLSLEKMVVMEEGKWKLLRTLCTSRVYVAADSLCESLPDTLWSAAKSTRIGHHLGPDLFEFRRQIVHDIEGIHSLENNLINRMPWIVTSSAPLLLAAQINTQAEFDRSYRTIVKEKEYQGKNLLFMSCLNIDISPRQDQLFPLTKCVPWAAYIQNENGESRTLEQSELVDLLLQQSTENPDQIDLEAAIQQMVNAKEIKIVL